MLQPDAERRQPFGGPTPFARPYGKRQQSPGVGHVLAQLDFRWNAAGVLQQPVSHAERLGNQAIIIQTQWLAAAGKVVEFAGFDRLPNSGFRELSQKPHVLSPRPLDCR